ncbi:antibiotic biosynthesis monooxygenase [Nocardia coubleae]|uniref:ABM domain-containing protein n=1 Tax=Nocardia coubleae TaxID=356147 RepID=A0A846W9J7_9NOCA|nr:antibiotic biosynthesis monooxygenase [Nocardia coubleae]NKX90099.1 hypothetical protein [Nocardia coubleae]
MNHPDLAGVVLTRHQVDDPEHQQSMAARLAERDLPPGLAAVTVLLDLRGTAVLTQELWTIPPTAATVFRSRRSLIFDPDGTPDCTVVTTFTFPTDRDAATWTDLLAEALRSHPVEGLLAQHLSTHGDSVLNCSDWTAPEAHQAFIENTPDTAAWHRVSNYPGLTHGPGARCRIYCPSEF